MPRSPTCATDARWWCASTIADRSSAIASSTCPTPRRPNSTCCCRAQRPWKFACSHPGRHVVSPATAPQITVVNAPAVKMPGAAPMFIQAGVFADHENARRRVEVLLAAGIELASLEDVAGVRTLHRVRVGPFASVEEFDLYLRRVRELGIPDARLLTD